MQQSDDAPSRHSELGTLHRRGDPLILVNVWDVASAKAVLDGGAAALATSSGALAASQGFPDGESLPLTDLLRVVERISVLSDKPLSVDLEAGYGDGAADVAASVRRVADAGAAGVNLEDGLRGGRRGLADPRENADRIAAARSAAPALFINARVDTFLLGGDGPEALSDAVERARCYLAAGADGVFVPGVAELETIRTLAERIDAPLNVLASAKSPSIPELAEAGVARISLGAWPLMAALKQLRAGISKLEATGHFGAFA